MKFWALASSLLLGAAAHAQSFGRFGYAETPPIPGFRFDLAGFRVADSPSDTFRFSSPIQQLKPISINDRVAEYQVIGLEGVDFLRVDLRKPGFELHFVNPIELRLSSLQNPLLSFNEGTFGPGIPTPPVSWAVVTFMDRQPPVFFNFTGDPQELTCRGSTGDWTLTTSGSPGWVRICAPRGIQPFSGENPEELGRLVADVSRNLPVFTGQPPQLVSFRMQRQGARVQAEWVFDRPGVWVPPSLVWAKEAGYELRFESPIVDAQADVADGPLWYTQTERLTVNFPCAKPPVGRPVFLGLEPELAAQGSPGEFIATALHGWPLYSAQARESGLIEAGQYSQNYFNVAPLSDVPIAGQKQPYDAAGIGTDLLAAHALNLALTGRKSAENPALSSLLWRRDWLAGGLWGEQRTALTRADSLAALSCWLSGEDARVLDGCLLWSGLMAELSRGKYMQRIGLEHRAAPMVVAWSGLLRGIFHRPGSFPDWSALSPLRVLGSERVFLQQRDGRLVLSWNASKPGASDLLFWSAKPLALRPLSNLGNIETVPENDMQRVRFVASRAGLCEAVLEWPENWPAIPPAGKHPRYTEAPLSKSML